MRERGAGGDTGPVVAGARPGGSAVISVAMLLSDAGSVTSGTGVLAVATGSAGASIGVNSGSVNNAAAGSEASNQ